jgi:hypothetical protein
LSLAVVSTLFLLASGAARAQESDPQEGGPLSKLSIHGFLTQAYAKSDGATIYGIPEDGTSDYRSAALQFRYAMTPKDDFVVQLSHLRTGANPLAGEISDVEVDWAFYQHRFADAFSLRAGKISIPLGVYNEIRDVGTLLPFYRANETVYPFVGFVPETVTGLALTTHLGSGPWSLEADLYGGQWEFRENDPPSNSATVKDAVGGQLWLSTPISGLRFGLGASRGKLEGSIITPPDGTLDQQEVVGSLEAKAGPLRLVAEYIDAEFEVLHYAGYYGQLSWSVSDRLGVHVQHSKADMALNIQPVTFFDLDFADENALSVTYAFRPEVLLKVEYHEFEGVTFESGAAGILGAPLDVSYGIASIATSF